jgi:thioredoxin reductase (NADPH)
MQRERIVIIGSGPAGLTAAIYTARAQLSTVVFTGRLLGGQIATTHEVENFPGFPNGTTGPELVENMKQQAERFGARFVYDSVNSVEFTKGSPFLIKTDSEDYLADAVIVTIGANPRALNIPGEKEYTGRGVSYCATCDGYFFRGKDIIVVGGGDSALQEGVFLTKFARSVNIVHRRHELRASPALQTRAFANPKISFTWDTVVEAVHGNANGVVQSVTLRNTKTNEVTTQPTDGVFIFIGYDPNSTVFGDQLETDASGYVKIDSAHKTNVEGVFAGGEIHDSVFRQAITAAGDGCKAALSAINWLEVHEPILQNLDESEPAPAGD